MPEVASQSFPKFVLTGYAFKFIAENGTTFKGSLVTDGVYRCIPEAETFPGILGPAEKATGKLILDVPAGHGILVLTDGLDLFGWEYAI